MKFLFLIDQWPYPEIKGGVERRIRLYKEEILKDYEVDMFFILPDEQGKLRFISKDKTSYINSHTELKPDYDFIIDFTSTKGRETYSYWQGEIIRSIQHYQNSLQGVNKTICNFRTYPTKEMPVLEVGGFYNDTVFINKNQERGNYCVCVGRISPDKNQLVLVANWGPIYEKYKTPLVLLGGSFEPEYFKEIKKYVDGEKIVLVPWQNDKQLVEYYNSCKLLIVPSLHETFCNVLVESMACGSEVVISGVYPGLSRDLDKFINSSTTTDKNGILNEVVSVLENNTKKNTEEGRQLLQEFYSLTKQKERIRNFINPAPRIGMGDAAIDQGAIDWIESLIPKGSTIVELGSGTGTTQYLCENYNLFSVENNSDWVGKYKSKYIYAPLVDDKWYHEESVVKGLPQDYQLLLIDGPVGERRPNIIEHFHIFKIGVPILLDDSQRPGEMKIISFLLENGYEIKYKSSIRTKKSWTYLEYKNQ